MKNILFTVVMLISCTDSESAVRVLENQGFTDVNTTGYSVFACSDDDTYHTGFTAKGPTGKYVSGTVCCGVFKNCTVRFE